MESSRVDIETEGAHRTGGRAALLGTLVWLLCNVDIDKEGSLPFSHSGSSKKAGFAKDVETDKPTSAWKRNSDRPVLARK